jgi:hypothetical protein
VKNRKIKKPSFLRKLIGDSWLVAVEHAKYMRSMRILSKQEWSIEFLEMLINRSTKNISFTLENHGNKLTINKNSNPVLKEPGGITELDLMEYLGIAPEGQL